MTKNLSSILAILTIVGTNSQILSKFFQTDKNLCLRIQQQVQSYRDGQIIDINTIGFYALKAAYTIQSPDYSPSNPIIDVTGISNTLASVSSEVTKISDTEDKNADTIYIGASTLVNNSDERQTQYTQSYSQAVENSTTTSIEKGFNISLSLEYKFEPADTGVKTTTTAQFNYNHTSSTTSSTTDTITAPSQPVTIPPHSEATVITSLNRVKETIQVSLKGYFTGSFTGTLHFKDRTTKKYTTDAVSGIVAARAAQQLPFLSTVVDVAANYQSIFLACIGDIYTSNNGIDYKTDTHVSPIKNY